MSDIMADELADDTFRLVVESAPNAIVMIDERGTIVLVNAQVEEIFGYPREELVGESIELLLPEAHRAAHRKHREAYLSDPQARSMGAGRELFGRRKDGSEVPVEIGLSPVKTPQGMYVLSAIVDISARRQAELALLQRERFLQTIFDTEPECVKLLDRDGRLLRINRAGLNMLEVESLQEVEGCPVQDMVVPEFREAFIEAIDEVFRGETATLEFECVGRTGARRSLEMHAVPVRDESGEITALLSITRDVSDKKQAEERARQAERLATIGQVVAGLAHESRNALQRSQAALEMLELEVEGNSEATELVGRVQKAQDHLRQLFDEVRNYAAPIKLDKTECTLSEIWGEAWALLSRQRAGRVAAISEHGNAAELSCFVDRFRLVQVCRNLLENALAACSDPVEIAIHTESVELGGTPGIRFTLRDNGPGMSPEAMQRAFEPFFTTKTRGTGLGLAISQRIVESHGGTISVSCQDGQGAEFVITIPRGVCRLP